MYGALLVSDFLHVDDDDTIRIFRGADDSVYLQKSCGKVGQIASVREAFAELEDTERPGEPATIERYRSSDNADDSWSNLSEYLQRCGEELTDAEAAVIDAAHIVSKGFKKGQGVNLRQLERVALRYHSEHLNRYDFKLTVSQLIRRGLCDVQHGPIVTLSLVKHCNKSKRDLSRFARLGLSQSEDDLLIACHHCSGKTFKHGYPVSRAAVKQLIVTRFNLSKTQVNATIKGLLDRGILMEKPGPGTTVLQLTPAAKLVMKKRAETLEAAQIALEDETPEVLPADEQGVASETEQPRKLRWWKRRCSKCKC